MDDSNFDAGAVVADAQAVDGLTDFGDDSYREPLEKLLWSLQYEAQLNAIGKSVLRQRVVDILATRLRVQSYISRYPEILEEQIEAEDLGLLKLPVWGGYSRDEAPAPDKAPTES